MGWKDFVYAQGVQRVPNGAEARGEVVQLTNLGRMRNKNVNLYADDVFYVCS